MKHTLYMEENPRVSFIKSSFGVHRCLVFVEAFHVGEIPTPLTRKQLIRHYHFYTPVWTTDVSYRGNVRPSVRPSVRPFFQHALRYQFETRYIHLFSGWHDMLSLSCNTIGSLCPSLQPKVSQTQFLQSWPHKWIQSAVFCNNIICGILAINFARFGFFEVIQTLFYMFWDSCLKLGIYMQLVVLLVKFEFHSNRDTLTYFTAKNRSKSFICIHGFKNYIEASDLVHTLTLWVFWSLLIFVMVGQFLAIWRTKTLERGCY